MKSKHLTDRLATMVDSTEGRAPEPQFHAGDKTGSMFICNVGGVSSLQNLKGELICVFLGRSALFQMTKEALSRYPHLFIIKVQLEGRRETLWSL